MKKNKDIKRNMNNIHLQMISLANTLIKSEPYTV